MTKTREIDMPPTDTRISAHPSGVHPRSARELTLRDGLLSAVGAVLGLALACQPSGVFLCGTDDDCTISGVGGVCQSDGYCSFPSEDCASGQQYGQYAPSELAGECVPEDGPEPGTTTGPATQVPPPPVGTTGPGPGPGPGADESTGDELTTGIEQTSGTSGEPPLDPSLVLWLTFDDLGGEVAYDQSGHGNDAFCYDRCPFPDGGIDGDALYFAGREALVVPFSEDFTQDEAFTITAWIQARRLYGEPMAIIEMPLSTKVNANWNSWELRLDGVGVPVHSLFFATANYGSQSVLELAPAPFDTDQWVHIAGVWDNDQLRLYLDGEEWDSIEAYPPDFDGQDIILGAGFEDGLPNDGFEGSLDDLRFYTRALSSQEIEQLVGSL